MKKLITKFTVTHLRNTGLILVDAARLHTPLVCVSLPSKQEEGVTTHHLELG